MKSAGSWRVVVACSGVLSTSCTSSETTACFKVCFIDAVALVTGLQSEGRTMSDLSETPDDE